MGTASTCGNRPDVSVIVPARNEQASIGGCLQSLVQQTGITFEIIVVDDGSTDGTRGIANSFPEVRVVSPPELRPNWTGKNNAIAAGARKAAGKWLLFTDADTLHLPGSLARAVTEASAHGAALLSYSPEQEVHGFWQHAVMPVVFAELAATYRPVLVNDPASLAAAANGQYLLVSREAYEAVGGHEVIAGEILEDVALARTIKRSGRSIRFRYGADAVRARMYRGFGQLREGWTKNLALLFKRPVHLAWTRLIEFACLGTGAVLTITAAQTRPILALTAGAATAAVYGLFLKRILKAHFSWRSNVLGIFGLPIFAYLLWRSKLSHEEGNVTWKGRVYGRAATTGPEQSRIITMGSSR